MNCANGYDPELNPRGCRYHHQHADGGYPVVITDPETGEEATEMRPWCAGPTCTGCRPHMAEKGLLCWYCCDRLETDLLQVARHWQELAHHLAPSTGAGQARVSGTPDQPDALKNAIYDHRHLTEHQLADWVDQHADTRPGDHRPWNRRYPPRSAAWLHTRLDWATTQPWIRDYLHELHHLTSRARALLDPSGQRHLRDIGPCSVEECTGQVTARLAPADDVMPPTLACDTHPDHVIQYLDWIRAYERAEKRRKREQAA